MLPWFIKNPILSAVITLCVALAVGLGVSRMQLSAARSDASSARTELAEIRADIAGQRETFERLARATEARRAIEMAAVAAANELRMADVRKTADHVAADLRAGNQRLQDHWAGCRATAALPGTAAAAAELARSAELRAASAGRVIAVGAECDASVSRLQSAIRVMQGAGQ